MTPSAIFYGGYEEETTSHALLRALTWALLPAASLTFSLFYALACGRVGIKTMLLEKEGLVQLFASFYIRNFFILFFSFVGEITAICLLLSTELLSYKSELLELASIDRFRNLLFFVYFWLF